jgi:FkbH-like protein
LKKYSEYIKGTQIKTEGLIKKKLALITDFPAQFLSKALISGGTSSGFNIDIYDPGINQSEIELFDKGSGLSQFAPEWIILGNNVQYLRTKFYKLDINDRSGFSEIIINELKHQISLIDSSLNCKFIIFNYPEYDDRILGSFANKTDLSLLYHIRKINFEMMKLSQENIRLNICDISSLVSFHGWELSVDNRLFVNASLPFSLDFHAELAQECIKIVSADTGKIAKCLIFDLDNTIWGGIIGDDGFEKIQIGNLGIGKAFSELQQWMLELRKRGIILAVSSKNDEMLAKEPFINHPEMVLRLDDITIFAANWDNKADNIKYIKDILNLGFDSMVFLDDNPFERNLVRAMIPDIIVPELPEEPAQYLDYLRSLNLFETSSITGLDAVRTEQYQTEAKRVELKRSFADLEDYLMSLEMIATELEPDKFNISRIAQLTQRSNQFNLRTVRYSESDITRLLDSENYIVKAYDLSDKFGDYGIIAVIILEKDKSELFIDTWLMSCRILKRGMEEFIINELVGLAQILGFEYITGEYLPTSKNMMVKELLQGFGFVPFDGKFKLIVNEFQTMKTFINKRI